MTLVAGGTSIDLTRISHGSGSARQGAWAGRYATAPVGAPNTGCQILSGAGCISAGAVSNYSSIRIANVSGSWDEGASDGLVEISGYQERLRVERGPSQIGAEPEISRVGSIRYWNGSSYSSIPLGRDLTTSASSEMVSRDFGNTTITAQSTISVTPAVEDPTGAAPCTDEACSIRVQNGLISIVTTYTLVNNASSTQEYQLSVLTVVNGSQASASYREPLDE